MTRIRGQIAPTNFIHISVRVFGDEEEEEEWILLLMIRSSNSFLLFCIENEFHYCFHHYCSLLLLLSSLIDELSSCFHSYSLINTQTQSKQKRRKMYSSYLQGRILFLILFLSIQERCVLQLIVLTFNIVLTSSFKCRILNVEWLTSSVCRRMIKFEC